MSLEIAWKQNILVKDSYLLKLLLVALGFGSQTFICGFSRQNICSVEKRTEAERDNLLLLAPPDNPFIRKHLKQ
jgi:hypothetical protein